MKKLIILGALAAFSLSPEVNAQSTTQLISVAGKQVNTKTSDLTKRKSHQPIVILEAGNSESLAVWDNLFDQVAEFSPVLAYDRPGLGKSSISEGTPTLDVRVKELESLLKKMNIEPPYVLVGNNWGNLLIREFAAAHPNEVEGMVYVDPVMDTDNPDKLRESLNSQNLDGELLVSEYLAFQRLSMSRRSPGAKPESDLFLTLLATNQLNWSSQAVPEVASQVIIGRKNNIQTIFGQQTAHYKEIKGFLISNKVDFFDQYSLENPEYSLLLSSGSMNYLPMQEPTQIAQSIRQVLYADPMTKIIKATQTLSIEEFGRYVSDMQTYIPASLLNEYEINMQAYNLMRFDKFEHALVLFKNNLENHPNSANAYDSMGDGLMALGKVEEAVPLYKKAVELGAQPQHSDLELFKKNLTKGEEMLTEKGK
ncbi:alpha/beta fold hydrolase [Algoriphagus aquimarinus]|uniref:Alpha/beta fold hydrolase n=1 Tax=Algoriphagus aquimarinus TaxID=237018 RepID=A0A5C7B1A5_9BACT|nr:alpha/beta hydrolase [Algoriphagus aquimarinus]TXE14207.1 alpha/beta fold hydrolase [Algoriphagus aquimarinus]